MQYNILNVPEDVPVYAIRIPTVQEVTYLHNMPSCHKGEVSRRSPVAVFTPYDENAATGEKTWLGEEYAYGDTPAEAYKEALETVISRNRLDIAKRHYDQLNRCFAPFIGQASDDEGITYAEDFLSKFPEAALRRSAPSDSFVPVVCRNDVYGGSKCRGFNKSCARCWLEKMSVTK